MTDLTPHPSGVSRIPDPMEDAQNRPPLSLASALEADFALLRGLLAAGTQKAPPQNTTLRLPPRRENDSRHDDEANSACSSEIQTAENGLSQSSNSAHPAIPTTIRPSQPHLSSGRSVDDEAVSSERSSARLQGNDIQNTLNDKGETNRDQAGSDSPAQTASHAVSRMKTLLPNLRATATSINTHPLQGRVVGATGTIIRAVLPNVAVGDLCRLQNRNRDWSLDAEVVGLDGREVLLAPMGALDGVSAETEVVTTGARRIFPVGERLLGRVLDALGNPIDARGPLPSGPTRPVTAAPPPAMERQPIERPLPVGLRAVDAMLTCGEGQRLGVYGEAGAGKSTLMSAIVKGSAADVAVVALVGERGREVREFVEHNLGPEGLKNTVLIVATSDRPAAERVVCAQAATSVAEYFRDQGLKVLLFVDNVTRYARALREIGLAAGEPPTRRGFPPSVFASLPQLMERTGMGVHGSITAFYMVLVEDGADDPIAEETRGILDGHIILSRALAASGHYPAIDILTSRSRTMNLVTDSTHRAAAMKFRSLWSKYQEIEFLLQVGEYKAGGDAVADEAIAKIEFMRKFLQQADDERMDFPEMLTCLTSLLA